MGVSTHIMSLHGLLPSVYISCNRDEIFAKVNVRGLSLFFFLFVLFSHLSVVRQSEIGELEIEGFFPTLFSAVIHHKYHIRKGAHVTLRSLSCEKLDFTVDWLGHLSTNSLVRHP